MSGDGEFSTEVFDYNRLRPTPVPHVKKPVMKRGLERMLSLMDSKIAADRKKRKKK